MKKSLIVIMVILIFIAALFVLGNKNITTEININAPAHKVWSIIIDFNKYPEWNPFIRNAKGKIKQGEIIEVTFKTHGSDPITFTPKIIQLKEDNILQWEGKLIMPGIFTGRHTFQLVSLDKNTTKLVQKEDFNGILVPFFNYNSTIDGFNAMNKKIKSICENK